jgi:hypothetical protein
MTGNGQDSNEQRGGLPYFEIEFAEDGRRVRDTGLGGAVAAGSVDDVFVFSHGWNSGADSARRLYDGLFGILGDILARRAPDRAARTAVVGVFWPSLLFPEDDPAAPPAAAATVTSGRALAEALIPAFPENKDNLVQIGRLLDRKGGADDLAEFHERAKQLVTTTAIDAGEDSGEAAAGRLPTGSVISYYSGWPAPEAHAAQGLRNPVDALWGGAREVLRTLSYYEMKNRAGVVGRDGLGPFLSTLATADGRRPRVHLLGHSFGARLVAYALSGLGPGLVGQSSPVKSLTLIQGAFSHYAFTEALPFDASRVGALAGYRDRVDGPLLSTFSGRDRAVGWWYPLASMLSRQDASSQQELLHRWGAMGADGYQVDNGVTLDLGTEGCGYGFVAGNCYRLDANNVIQNLESPFAGAHSDICHPEVAWAAIAASGVTD